LVVFSLENILPVPKGEICMTSTSLKEDIRANRKEFIEKTAALKLPANVKVGTLLIHGLRDCDQITIVI
jgi:hypothetical protein